MKKLNKQKIKWIIQEVRRGDIGAYTIGKIQNITHRHVRRVCKKYEGIKDPILLQCGRKPKEITEEERTPYPKR